jgi:triacylglycerol lipase
VNEEGPTVPKTLRRAALAVAAAALLLTTAAPAGAATTAPGVSPPGANDWSCRPTAAHPEPVVLVHGTFGDMTVSWNTLSPALVRDGYCVFALDYGDRATGRIEDSAQELATFVDRVLSATGAAKVDIVGHSQGGMMPRYYIKNLGGDAKVDDLVGLSPSNHGTTNPFAPPLAPICPACAQQAAGSSFLQQLNSGDETPGPVSYTNIATRYDEVVTPYTSAFLHPDDDQVTNITLQDKCPNDTSEHLRVPYDPPAIAITLNALGRSGPADPAYQPPCTTA